MLQPIPSRILKHTVTLQHCTGVDMWQAPTWDQTTLSRVCMQPSNETKKAKDNTEVVLRGVCFVDARRSSPAGIDLDALQKQSESNGWPMTLLFDGNQYTILTVDTLYDDTGILHHTELGLV